MKYILTTLVLLVFNDYFTQEITVEKIWKKFEYRAQGVLGFNSLADGDRYTQLDDQGNLVLAFISKPNQAPSVLIDANTLTYKGKKVIIEDYSFDKSERKVLIMTSINPIYRRSYSAVYYLYDLDTKVIEALSEEHSPQTLAEYSPDGKKVACTLDNTKISFNGNVNSRVSLADFSNTTGRVINEAFIVKDGNPHGCAFSPNSTYLYINPDVRQALTTAVCGK